MTPQNLINPCKCDTYQVGSTKEHNQQDIKAARYVSSTNTGGMLSVVKGSFFLFVLDERKTIVPNGQDVSAGALTCVLLSRWGGVV